VRDSYLPEQLSFKLHRKLLTDDIMLLRHGDGASNQYRFSDLSGISIQRNARNTMNASNVRNVRNAMNAMNATHVRNASSNQ